MDFDTIVIERVIPPPSGHSEKRSTGSGETYVIHSRDGMAFEIAPQGSEDFGKLGRWYYQTPWRQLGHVMRDEPTKWNAGIGQPRRKGRKKAVPPS